MFEILTKGQTIVLFDPTEDNMLCLRLTAETRAQYMNNPPRVIGKLIYSDTMGQFWEIGFAFAPEVLWSDKFGRRGGREYNYERQVAPPHGA